MPLRGRWKILGGFASFLEWIDRQNHDINPQKNQIHQETGTPIAGSGHEFTLRIVNLQMFYTTQFSGIKNTKLQFTICNALISTHEVNKIRAWQKFSRKSNSFLQGLNGKTQNLISDNSLIFYQTLDVFFLPKYDNKEICVQATCS